jgi:hypothetical protein
MQENILEKIKTVQQYFEKIFREDEPEDCFTYSYLNDIELFIKSFTNIAPEIDFKIYPDGVGLSWSTITDLIDDTDELKLLTIDLIEQREVIKSKFKEVENLYKKLKEHLDFNIGNISQTLKLAQKRFNLSEIKFTQNGKLYYIEPRPEEHIYFGVDKLSL